MVKHGNDSTNDAIPFSPHSEAQLVQLADSKLIQQAEGYLALDLPKEAIKALKQVAIEARDSFEWNFWMGESLRSSEQHTQAILHLQKARKIKPEVIAIYINLGWCLKRTDRLELAIDALLEAEGRCRQGGDVDELALVMYNLGCYYSLAGQKERMLQWLELALAKEPAYRQSIPQEPDFDNFRDDLDFQRLAQE